MNLRSGWKRSSTEPHECHGFGLQGRLFRIGKVTSARVPQIMHVASKADFWRALRQITPAEFNAVGLAKLTDFGRTPAIRRPSMRKCHPGSCWLITKTELCSLDGPRTCDQDIHQSPGALLPVGTRGHVGHAYKCPKQIEGLDIFSYVADLDCPFY